MTAAVIRDGLPIWEVQAALLDFSAPILNILKGGYTFAHNVTLLRTKNTAIEALWCAEESSGIGRECRGLRLSPCLVGGRFLGRNGCALCPRCISGGLECKGGSGGRGLEHLWCRELLYNIGEAIHALRIQCHICRIPDGQVVHFADQVAEFAIVVVRLGLLEADCFGCVFLLH
jgi:hypothetical protein